MNAENSAGETIVDLFLRADGTAVWTRQQAVIDRVKRLEESGSIDRYRLQTWNREASLEGPLAETMFHRAAVTKVDEFENWARGREERIDLPFERDEIDSTITEESFSLVRLPVVCVAIYNDDRLVAVAPCGCDDEYTSVEDLLDPLEREERPSSPVYSTPE